MIAWALEWAQPSSVVARVLYHHRQRAVQELSRWHRGVDRIILIRMEPDTLDLIGNLRLWTICWWFSAVHLRVTLPAVPISLGVLHCIDLGEENIPSKSLFALVLTICWRTIRTLFVHALNVCCRNTFDCELSTVDVLNVRDQIDR